MNVYDFDKTIFRRDSTYHFYLFCLRRYPRVWRYLPSLAWAAALFFLDVIPKTEFKERFYRFLQGVPDVEQAVEQFWNLNIQNIFSYYRKQKRSDDVVISASPEFLVKPAMARLGVFAVIASRVDPKTGKYTGENCHGEEKVRRFHAEYPGAKVKRFYSDSLSDTPMAEQAEESFVVTKKGLVPWKEYTPRAAEKLKSIFFSGQFMVFVGIGAINTLSCILFSMIYSVKLDANLSYIAGYVTSLLISYALNSRYTFHSALSFGIFVKFAMSYIPNFLIQNGVILLFYNALGWHKLICYVLAAIIGIPVTFLVMKVFAFGKKK